MKKIHIISDTNNKSLKIKNFLTNKLKSSSLKKSSLIKINSDFEDVIRSFRRGIRGVEKTLTNVSKGRFP